MAVFARRDRFVVKARCAPYLDVQQRAAPHLQRWPRLGWLRDQDWLVHGLEVAAANRSRALSVGDSAEDGSAFRSTEKKSRRSSSTLTSVASPYRVGRSCGLDLVQVHRDGDQGGSPRSHCGRRSPARLPAEPLLLRRAHHRRPRKQFRRRVPMLTVGPRKGWIPSYLGEELVYHLEKCAEYLALKRCPSRFDKPTVFRA